jgi:hypothetical protein
MSCAGFIFSVLGAGAVLFPGIDRWQDNASVISRIDRDTDGRALDLYAPDETTLALVDLYAPRHRGQWRIAETGKTSPALLVLLPGHADGAFTKALRAWGINVKSPSSAHDLDTLEQRQGLRVERIYEVPEGRRYAVLVPSVVSAPHVLSAKTP